mgnify:CR=1 FL=1
MMTPTNRYTTVEMIGTKRVPPKKESTCGSDELYVAIAQATLHLVGLVQAFDRLEFARSLLCTTIHIRIGHTDFISLLCRPIVTHQTRYSFKTSSNCITEICHENRSAQEYMR